MAASPVPLHDIEARYRRALCATPAAHSGAYSNRHSRPRHPRLRRHSARRLDRDLWTRFLRPHQPAARDLARVTANQEYCALIDTSDAFDPASAAEAGVHLSRVLWIRCGGNAEHALKAADLIVQAGGFGLIAMDLADTPPRTAARISLASWFRLRHAVERTPAALVVLAQTLHAKSCSHTAIGAAERRGALVGRTVRQTAARHAAARGELASIIRRNSADDVRGAPA